MFFKYTVGETVRTFGNNIGIVKSRKFAIRANERSPIIDIGFYYDTAVYLDEKASYEVTLHQRNVRPFIGPLPERKKIASEETIKPERLEERAEAVHPTTD